MLLRKNGASVENVRRLGALLICCFILCAALRPALPVFLCLGMEGARLSHPCCPPASDADHYADSDSDSGEGVVTPERTWARVCCQAALPALADSSRPPPEPQRMLPTLGSALIGPAPTPPPISAALISLPRRHGEPQTSGPAPPLRVVLRI